MTTKAKDAEAAKVTEAVPQPPKAKIPLVMEETFLDRPMDQLQGEAIPFGTPEWEKLMREELELRSAAEAPIDETIVAAVYRKWAQRKPKTAKA